MEANFVDSGFPRSTIGPGTAAEVTIAPRNSARAPNLPPYFPLPVGAATNVSEMSSAETPVQPQTALRRSRTIDICRGLLFLCMASTHALTLAGVTASHWLRSDVWLPNGWATLVFVVLSGYGVGYVYSVRAPAAARDASLARREYRILLVMFVSNAFFVALKSAMDGDAEELLSLGWWWGFIDLDTPWTISGVLLPTALVMLLGPWLIRLVQQSAARALATILVTKVLVSLAAVSLHASPEATEWWARLLFLEGLGGFPVLPFVLNGSFGVWLGMLWHRSQPQWLNTMTILLALQLLTYATTFAEPAMGWTLWREVFGAVGKFGWVFLLASALAKPRYRGVSAPLSLLGHFGLGSFVWHRVFLQAIAIGLGGLAMVDESLNLPPALRYAILCGGTLWCTWAGCRLVMARRQRQASLAGRAVPGSAETYITR